MVSCSMWCMWGTVLLRISHLTSPAALPWLWFSGWYVKYCNMTDHLLLPFLQGCFCTSCLQLCCTKKWAVESKVSPCFANWEWWPAWLSERWFEEKHKAPCFVILADGGYPAVWAVELSVCCSCFLPPPYEDWYPLCVQNLKSSVNMSRSPPSKQTHGLIALLASSPLTRGLQELTSLSHSSGWLG